MKNVSKVVVRARKITNVPVNLNLYILKAHWGEVAVPIKSFELPGTGFVDCVYDLTAFHNTAEGDAGIAQIAIGCPNAADALLEFEIESVKIYPSNYFEGQYLLGSLQQIAGYGTADEQVLTSLKPGDISAVLSAFYNHGEGEQEITLINALYQGDKLVDAAIATTQVGAKCLLAEPLIATLADVPETDGTYSVKHFLWNGITMQPLNTVTEIR